MDAYWVTIKKATELLGKSDKTIRRWVDQDKLPIDRSQRPYRVDISTYYQDTGTPRPDMSSVSSTVDTLTAEVDRLTTQVDQLQRWNEELLGERDYLRQMLAGAIATNAKRIEAPRPRRTVLEWLGFRRRPEEQ